MRNKKHACGLSLFLCAVLLAGQLGTTIYAEGTASDTEGLCEHHPEHTAECGYVEAVEGHPCEHIHTDDCYTDKLVCGYEEENMEPAPDSDAAHEHTKECYELDCPHERGEHDDCGYKETVEGHLCSFICGECSKESEQVSGNGLPGQELPETDIEKSEETAVFVITAFDMLDEKTQYQTVTAGTKLSELDLPNTLRVSGYKVNNDTEPTLITIEDVTWEPDTEYDDIAEQGAYVFTPVLPDSYTCAKGVDLPEIYVRIGSVNAVLANDPNDENNDGYHDGDVAAIIAMIDGNGLLRDKDTPGNWKGITWSSDIPKRILRLYFYDEELSGTLDVSDLTELTSLLCYGNHLTALKGLGNLTELNSLHCSNNQLASLDGLENLTKLTTLFCEENQLTGPLKVGGLTSLTGLVCRKNQLTELAGLENLEKLESLQCGDNKLKTLDVSKLTNLTKLACGKNELTALTGLEKLEKLERLHCYDNQLTGTLDVSKLTKLEMLSCENNQFSHLVGLEQRTKLTWLDFSNNGHKLVETLDVSNMDQLTHLGCSDSQLTELTGLEVLTKLTDLDCSHNQLKGTLNLEGLSQLTELDCSDNQLTGLKNPSSMKHLTCSNNPLTQLTGLEKLTNLSLLECSNIQLAGTLDVSNLTKVWGLDCSHNPLTELVGLEKLNLSGLDCSTTQLTMLDLSGQSWLGELYCGNTPLTSFTDPDGHKLTIQPASGGKIIFGSNDPNKIDNYGYDLVTGKVTLTAVPDSGKALDGWMWDGAGAGSVNPLVFDLSGNSTVTAAFKNSGSAPGGGSTPSGESDGDSNNSHSYVTITTPQPPKPDNPVLAVIEIPVTVKEGTATGTADDGSTSEAITTALNTSKQTGREKYGIALRYDAITAEAYDGFSITIKRATLDRLIDPNNGVKYLTLNTSVVDLTFDLAALREIAKQSTGDITLMASREKALTGDLLTAVGTRPAYRLTVGYTDQDGTAAFVTSFGAGRVTVRLAYKPAADEQTGSLFLVYSKDGKNTEWLYQSSYDLGSGNLTGSTGHFSVYGVGYKPAPVYADTVNHWAKEDINFVASRGLLGGTDENAFVPDGIMTHGMLVLALGQLAGIDPAAYPSVQFSNADAAAYYTPYVEWASSKGIIIGTGEKTFVPDAAVTREEIAVMMKQYAAVLGYTLPIAREAEIFTDNNKITGSMKSAVQAMQQAGVMNSKENHLFAPKDTVTRAEAAAILRRFVEIVIDPYAAGDRR